MKTPGPVTWTIYNGQHVICSHCHALEHQVKECTKRPKPKCNLCLQEGHTKNNCPTAQLWPTCYGVKTVGTCHMDVQETTQDLESKTCLRLCRCHLTDYTDPLGVNHYVVVKPAADKDTEAYNTNANRQ